MPETLRPLSAGITLSVWIEIAERRIRSELDSAGVGQCLRVTDLPRPVLERIGAELADEQIPGVEVYLVDQQTGPEPWRVGVHKVVERRNAEEAVVLALFPPDLQLAAGDSVDISTF